MKINAVAFCVEQFAQVWSTLKQTDEEEDNTTENLNPKIKIKRNSSE